jgi:hypothetical protein
VREAGADGLGAALDQQGQGGQDPPERRFYRRRRDLGGRVRTDLEGLAPIRHDREPLDVVDRLAGDKCVGSAGVVADHPADRAPGMGRRVRPEREPMGLGGPAKVVEHHPPGSTRAIRRSGSISRICRMWRLVSRTMPTVTAWPARLVPAPRGVTGTLCAAQSRIAETMSAASFGQTTPIGIWR